MYKLSSLIPQCIQFYFTLDRKERAYSSIRYILGIKIINDERNI